VNRSPEGNRSAGAQQRVGGVAVAAAVQVDELLGGGADDLDQLAAVADRQQGGREPVGAVRGVAQPGEHHLFGGAPSGELVGDPAQVAEQRATRMRDARGAVVEQESFCTRAIHTHECARSRASDGGV
jgi:hypothetical protein